MTVDDAADWMVRQFAAMNGVLYQEYVATHLLHLHDPNLAYYDDNGNVCIGKSVLQAFNRLTPDLVYERADKFWRNRRASDQSGRQQ